MASTFQLWPPNAEALIKNEEDRAFLQSMKTDGAASFGSFDKLLAQKVARQNHRAADAAKQVKHARLDMEEATATVSSCLIDIDCSDSDNHGEQTGDSDYEVTFASLSQSEETNKESQKKKQTGTSILIPPDIPKKTTKIVSLATRLKMTLMQQAAYL